MTAPSRLFLALMPPAEIRAEIEKAARDLNIRMPHGGRMTPPEKFHLTLVFLGHSMTLDDQFDVTQIAERISADPFQLRLDIASCFPDAGAWWFGPRQAPGELAALRADWMAQLKAAEITPERTQFNPHVTVARSKLRLPPTPIKPIEWKVTDFVLIRSMLLTDQSIYEEVGRWPLRRLGQQSLL